MTSPVLKPQQKVRHPRKPEWGVGTVQKKVGDDRVQVLFSQAGMKILATKFISLQEEDPQRQHRKNISGSVSHRMQMRRTTTPHHLKTAFDDSFCHTFAPAWKHQFLKENLPEVWMEQFPGVFCEEDYQHACSVHGRKSHVFFRWLGGVLFYETQGFRALPGPIRTTLSHHDKILRNSLTVEQYMACRSFLQQNNQQRGWQPDLFVYTHDFQRLGFVVIQSDHSPINQTAVQQWRDAFHCQAWLLELKPEVHPGRIHYSRQDHS